MFAEEGAMDQNVEGVIKRYNENIQHIYDYYQNYVLDPEVVPKC